MTSTESGTAPSNAVDPCINPATDKDVYKDAYRELCATYRAIEDFRAKLLGLLPLATVVGIFVLVDNLAKISDGTSGLKLGDICRAIGLFGFAVTCGLFCYELYGIRKCHALIRDGKKIECELGIRVGQFTGRPQALFGIINEPFAAGVIYPAILAAWLFFAYAFPSTSQPGDLTINPDAWIMAEIVFLVGLLATIVYDLLLRWKYLK